MGERRTHLHIVDENAQNVQEEHRATRLTMNSEYASMALALTRSIWFLYVYKNS